MFRVRALARRIRDESRTLNYLCIEADNVERGFEMFENANSLLACDGRESVDKIIDRVACGQKIDERLYRHTSSGEYRRPTHHLSKYIRQNLSYMHFNIYI